MKPRMDFYHAAPDTIKALSALETQIQNSGLEQSLIELVKTRASQINGCAFCINMLMQKAQPLICEARVFTNSISDCSRPLFCIWVSSALSALMVSGAA